MNPRVMILSLVVLCVLFTSIATAQDSPATNGEQAMRGIPLPQGLAREALQRVGQINSLLLTEDFSYTSGTNLNGQGGWSAHSAAGTNPQMITSGGLTYSGYPSSGIGNAVSFTTSGEDNNKPFASFPDGITSGSLYYAVMVNLDSAASTGDYFFHLLKNSSTFTARIFARRAANGNLRFGIGRSSTIGNINFSDSVYTPGTTYLMVVKYTVITGTNNDTVALWINPALGPSEPAPTVLQSAADRATVDIDTVYGVAIRQGTAANAPIGRVDGIRVGTSWSDVVLPGPLTGTKTIGGTSPDYPSFTAAIADLSTLGVGTGGVTFQVRPGVYGTDPGTEADTTLVINAVMGASSGNQITFVKQSGTVLLERSGSTAASEFILFLNGADWITFDGIDFRQRPGGNGLDLPIVLQNASATDGCWNNTFKNFVVTMNNLTNTAFSTGVLQTMAFTATSLSGTNSYNKYYNFTITGPAHGFQLFGTQGLPDIGVEIGTTGLSSSTISYGSTTIFNAAVGFGNQDSIKVFNIDVVSGTQSAAVSLYGIAAPFAGSTIGTASIYKNRVRGLSHTGTTTGNNRAIAVVNVGTFDIYDNVVYNISHATTSSAFVAGISIEAAANCRVFNNFVSDIKAPTGTGTTVPTNRGISATGGNLLGIHYNTVYLDAPNSSVSRTSSAFYVTATPTMVDYRNNIFINKSANGSGTTGRQAALVKSSTSLVNLASTSNNNLLYAGPVAGSTNKRAIFYPATGTGDTTLAQYKTRMAPLETAAVTEDVTFVNTTTPPYDLHINSAVATRAESGGNNVPGITTDIDGDTRVVALINTNVAPDIGADEFSGTPIDEIGPSIAYTSLSATTSTGNRSLPATIKDLVSGVHEGSGFRPRAYYKKNGGSNWASPQVDSAGVRVGDVWTFTFSAANLGGLVIGDTVYYYVAAADSSGNTSTNPAGGSGLPPGSTAPPVTNFYRINSAIAGTMTIGASGATFTSVKAAFDSVNASSVTAPVTFLINTDYAGEAVFPIVLNAVSYDAGGPFTVTLKPNTGATPTISGSSANAIIRLNGADNVIIDGSNSPGGTTRDLTITNTSTAANTAAIWLSSLGASSGATDNVIKNCNLSCGVNQVTSSSASFGIIGSGTTISSTGDGPGNNNNTITNNYVTKARFGIFLRGAATEMNNNNVISRNIVGPTSFGPDEIGSVGITIQHQNQATVTENVVRFVGGAFAQTPSGADRIGIGAGSAFWPITSTTLSNCTITRNLIHDIREDRTFSAVGIVLGSSSAPANNLIANNMMYNLRANATPGDQVVGIAIGAGSGDRVVYNSILLNGPMDTTGITASSRSAGGIVIGSTAVANLTLKNNISYVDVTSTTASLKHYAIIAPSTAFNWGTGGSDHNDFFINTANPQMALGGIGTANPYTDVTDLAAWRTQFTPPQDANSISADPLFVSTSNPDLHIQTGALSPVDSAGVPIAGVTLDFDGDTRNATVPDIGADEFTFVPAPLAGTYTIGAGGSYTTLSQAVADLQSLGVSAPVTFLFTQSSYTDTAQIIGGYQGQSQTNMVTFRPASGVTARILFTGGTNAFGVRMDSASGITWDGSNSGGLDRSLTLECDTIAPSRNVFLIRKGSSYLTFKNLILKGNRRAASTSNDVFRMDNQTFAAAGPQHHITVDNCHILRGLGGIFARGASGAVLDHDLTFTRNLIGGASTTELLDNLAGTGVLLEGNRNVLVDQNDINGVKVAGNPQGVRIQGANDGVTMTRNRIRNLVTLSGAARPICILIGNIIATGPAVKTRAFIANNIISDIHNFGTGGAGRAVDGIIFNPTGPPNSANGNGSFVELYNNTWNIDFAAGEGAGNTSFIFDANFAGSNTTVGHVDSIVFINNVASSRRADSLASRMWLIIGPSGFPGSRVIQSDRNVYYYNVGPFAQIPTPWPDGGSAFFATNLQVFRDTTGLDLNSVFGDPRFISSTAGHIRTDVATPVESRGTPIAGVTIDIDGDARNATTPDIGADEGFFIPYSLGSVAATFDSGTATVNLTWSAPSRPVDLKGQEAVDAEVTGSTLPGALSDASEVNAGDAAIDHLGHMLHKIALFGHTPAAAAQPAAEAVRDVTARITRAETLTEPAVEHSVERADADFTQEFIAAPTEEMLGIGHAFMTPGASSRHAIGRSTEAQGDGSLALLRYRIYRSVAGGPFVLIDSVNAAASSYNDAGVQARSYAYYLVAVFDDGTSQPSATVNVNVPFILAEQEPNNTAGTANYVGLGHAVSSNLSPAGDFDWFRFTAPVGHLVVDGFNTGNTTDVELFLYDSTGTTLLYHIDRNINDRLEYNLTYAGTYFVRVIGYQNATGPYSMFARIAPGTDPREPDDGPLFGFPLIATSINPAGYRDTSATIDPGVGLPGFDLDYRYFTMTSGQQVTVTLRTRTTFPSSSMNGGYVGIGRKGVSASLLPQAFGGSPLASGFSTTGTNVTIQHTATVADTYYVYASVHLQSPGFGLDQAGPNARYDVEIDAPIIPPVGWTVQTSGTSSALFTTKAVSQSVAWAGGANGTVLRTLNTGNTWSNVGGGAIGTGAVYNIFASNQNAALATTTPATTTYIFRTTNGGASWDTVFVQDGGFINAIHMFDATTGIAQGDPVGGTWTILRTTNAGASWSRIATEPAQVGGEYGANNGMAVLGTTHIWFTPGTGNGFYRTTDGGLTWSRSTLPASGFTAGVAFISQQIGVVGNNAGAAARTTDGGATWSAVTMPGSGAIYGMAASGPDLFASRGSAIYRSTDRGSTWTLSFSGSIGTFNHISFVTYGTNSTSGWGVTSTGGVAGYFGTTTGVEQEGNEIPETFELAQNYPNPFNPSTTIRFGLPRESNISIRIYNILGQEVVTLFEGIQSPGTFSTLWNGRNRDGAAVSSGVYFYRLEARPIDGSQSFSSMRKMLLLK